MDFALTSEQEMMLDSARQMVARDIEPVMGAHDPEASLPRDAMLQIFAVLARQGLTAPRLSEEEGGSGLAMLDYGLMFEQLPPFLGISVMAHESTIARIVAACTPEQRERFIPDLIAGRKITCTATTEPDVGSNPREVKTRVREDGNELVITGRKMWCSNASIADVINVTCGEETSGADDGVRMRRVLIEAGAENMEVAEIDTLGLRQGHLTEIVFEDCRVPSMNGLGAAGDAAKVLTVSWNVNRPLVGLLAVGLAQKALDAAVEYAGMRSQFGKTIGGHQLIQERLADIETAVVSSRLMCYHALAAVDRGEHANGISAMAKRYATTSCRNAISLAMGVHGAMGISQELGLEKLYRDVRMLPIPDATDEILTLIQGRELTGIAAFRG